MAPQSFETHVYSLQPAFCGSLDTQGGGNQQENIVGQSAGCFALEGIYAAARNQHHKRRKANTVPWNQGIVLKKSDGFVQLQGKTSTVQMATPTPVEGFSPAPACDNSMASHGHQYSDDHHRAWRGYSLDAESGYCSSFFLVPGDSLTLALLVRRIGVPIAAHNTHSSFPMTKSAMDNHFFATTNSNYPRQASDVELLLPSPPPSGLRPIS